MGVMNTLSVVKNSLFYPFTDIKRFILLFILFSGSFLLFPAIFAFGYSLKIVRTSINGSNTLPSYLGSEGMFSDGVRFIGALFIYNIPYYLISLLILHSIKQTDIITSLMPSLILISINFIMSIISFIGVAYMAHETRFKSAFEFRTLFKLIALIGWKPYLFILLILIIAQELLWWIINSLVYPLSNIMGGMHTIMGFIAFFLIYGLVYAYLMIFINRLRGLIYPSNLQKD